MSERYKTRGSEALNRKLEFRGLPSTEPQIVKKPIQKKKTQLNYERYADSVYAPEVTAFGFFMLAISLVALIYVCILYLNVNDRIVKVNKEAGLIQIKTEKLKTENDNKENKLYSQIDLEKIREKAIRDLGMVYPYKNHVITYKAVQGGYVRQFGEIGGNKGKNVFEKILGLLVAR